MFFSSVLRAASALPRAFAELVPKATSEALVDKPRTLYQTLSRLPKDGVGTRVYQTRWQSKGIEGCYWEVSRVKLKCEGAHGKAWGRLVWRGKRVSEREECIPGSLKYMWMVGHSKGENLRLVQPISPLPVTRQIVGGVSTKARPGETEEDAKMRVAKELKAMAEKRVFDKTIEDALKEANL
ncbi:hypothetical protein M0805_007078 [Coniferiporia weirii]|nr:hypothetical protein M0805_007078 [Coniferiporia weirii]